MWINDSINQINEELRRVEVDKEITAKLKAKERENEKKLVKDIVLNPNGFLGPTESNIWCRTKAENTALENMRIKLLGYNPGHDAQRNVLRMTGKARPKFVILTGTQDDLNKYIKHSAYWHKRSVEIMPKDQKSKVMVIYADNDDMQCVIFEYLGHKIVTTYTSFNNFLRQIEGKFTEQVFVTDEVREPINTTRTIYDADGTRLADEDIADIKALVDGFNFDNRMGDFMAEVDRDNREKYKRNLL